MAKVYLLFRASQARGRELEGGRSALP